MTAWSRAADSRWIGSSPCSRPDRRRPSGCRAERSPSGSPADVTVFDPNMRGKVDPQRFVSRGRSTPFAGWELRARPWRRSSRGRSCGSGSSSSRPRRRLARPPAFSCSSREAEAARPAALPFAVAEGFSLGADFERFVAWARRRGIEVQSGPEGSPVPKRVGAAHVSAPSGCGASEGAAGAIPDHVRRPRLRLRRDDLRGEDVAVFLADPGKPGEVVRASALAASRRSSPWRRIGSSGRTEPAPLRVRLGRTDEGRPLRRGGRPPDDRPGLRPGPHRRPGRFFQDLKREKRGAQEWELRGSRTGPGGDAGEALAAASPASSPFAVRVFPDAATKALYTGSSRPADLVVDAGKVRVDMDVSAPAKPDLVSPVFAAAALAARRSRCSPGARRSSWPRERGASGPGGAATSAASPASPDAAGAEPTVEEILESVAGRFAHPRRRRRRVLAGRGARLDGEAAAEKALLQPDAGLRREARPVARGGPAPDRQAAAAAGPCRKGFSTASPTP